MSKSLGTISLPDGGQNGVIEWVDRYVWVPVVGSQLRTLSGNVVTFSQGLTAGRPITLEVRNGASWISKTTVDDLCALAAQPNVNYSFVWDSESYVVQFRYAEPPVVDITPIWPESNLYMGRIRLITV